MIDRAPTANNFDSLLPNRYDELMKLMDKLPAVDALRVAGVMNARYIVSQRDWPLPVVQRGREVTIYRNDAAIGRAWIVPQARVVGDSLTALADPSFDLRQAVLLTSQVAEAQTSLKGTAGGVESLQDSPNAVTIRAASESGGFMVLADTFYPGWQATLDGRPAEILRANHAFRAVALSPGEHTVVFRYWPLSFQVGAAVSLLTLAAVIGWLTVLSRRRRVRDDTKSHGE
jgi:hypothetical protein